MVLFFLSVIIDFWIKGIKAFVGDIKEGVSCGNLSFKLLICVSVTTLPSNNESRYSAFFQATHLVGSFELLAKSLHCFADAFSSYIVLFNYGAYWYLQNLFANSLKVRDKL